MPKQLYMEDIEVGDRWYSGQEAEITAEDIIAFAHQYDPQPGHVSHETALDTPFEGLAASGWQTAAVTMRLMVELAFYAVMGLSINMSWPTPTRPGDRLHVDAHVISKRQSRSKPDRGIVEVELDSLNQDGEVRMHAQTSILVFYRNPTTTAVTA
ncbi:MAG: MaoC family dehydratase N-terminal domain-containing protein [Propionibacteriaceae bacterium]|nr:MaoC family dehydratase N-terminal domain-containing protein [Propionibacteriaceae bacterium]